jgi:hypothetical protein
MNSALVKGFAGVGLFVTLVIFSSIFGLLLAFPVKWTWNYVMPYIFELPKITWGHAWCLNFLAGMLVQSHLSHNSSK